MFLTGYITKPIGIDSRSQGGSPQQKGGETHDRGDHPRFSTR